MGGNWRKLKGEKSEEEWSVWEGEIETINRFSKTLNGFYAK